MFACSREGACDSSKGSLRTKQRPVYMRLKGNLINTLKCAIADVEKFVFGASVAG